MLRNKAVLAAIVLSIGPGGTKNAVGEDFDPRAVLAMDKGIAECERAQEERVLRRPRQALAHIDLFLQHKREAYAFAPTMEGSDEIAAQVRRCDRLASIIEQSNERYEEQRASIDIVLAEGEAYVRQCEQGLRILEAESIDNERLLAAAQAIGRAKRHKENISGQWMAFKIFRSEAGHPAQTATADKLEKGNACMVQASMLITNKEQEVIAIEKRLERHLATALNSRKACDSAERMATLTATEKHLESARALLREARAQQEVVNGQLRADNILVKHANWPQVTKIKSSLATISSCLKDAGDAVSDMATTVRERAKQLALARATAEAKTERLAIEKKESDQASAPNVAFADRVDEVAVRNTDKVERTALDQEEVSRVSVNVETKQNLEVRKEAKSSPSPSRGLASIAARIEQARLEAQVARLQDVASSKNALQEGRTLESSLAGTGAEETQNGRDNVEERLPEHIGLSSLSARLKRARLEAEEAAHSSNGPSDVERPRLSPWSPPKTEHREE